MLIRPRLAAALSLAILAACGEQQPSTATPKAVPQQQARPDAAADWTRTAVLTPEGGVRMGNPEARAKVVEFASFTCPACRNFHIEGGEPLKAMVRAGSTSWEYRPFLLNIFDLAAALLARCDGPENFFRWADQLYADHERWVAPLARLTERDLEPIARLPADQQVLGVARLAGLDEFARKRGMPSSRFEACMRNQAEIDRLTRMQQAAADSFRVSGTPTFVLNGRRLDGVTSWPALQPRLQEAAR